MSFVVPIDPIGAGGEIAAPTSAGRAGAASFQQLLLNGIGQVDEQLKSADSLATAFATDEAIAPHQVTIALEQARLSLELLLQVRTNLLEGYQEIMRMQV